ncbi:fimbrial protein [Bordetella trematum]|uniref:fimbrial protein n=1 Tax=Bordetella trematum TaxID=123899 RepID=UPI000D9571CB|nr:fimbrial protein [Bordetella trematum]SPU49141.1 fimbrial subunit [Bordetella trematum]VDH04092.1 putative fimbrial protein SthA [Bordetella trematum]
MTTPPASLPLRPARLIPLVVLPALLASSPAAHAVDGTITINGEITDQTCKINGSLPPANFIVNLPKISTSALKTKGDTAGATLFTIALSDCPATLTGKVKAHFEPGITTDYDSGTLYAYRPVDGTDTSTTSAPVASIPSRTSATKTNNVQIQLANTDGKAIQIGAEVNTAEGVELKAGGSDGKKSATLNYLARYYKSGNGDITAGKLVTYVMYSIVYP